MRIIIPMAGMGKRMRPHTLTTPKPLLPVAGKAIVQWLVEDLTALCTEKVEEIAYVVGRFGREVEDRLVQIAEGLGSKASIHYQDEALGTGHAILCAQKALKGKVIVGFADTLFRSGFQLDEAADGVIWVHKVDNPSSFGVVKTGKDNIITGFVEKPETFVSDLAIIGIYYFRDGETLRKELQRLIENDIRDKGEYQLTSALENMKSKGAKFAAGAVTEWLDCGNKDATVFTNRRLLELRQGEPAPDPSLKSVDATVVQPCCIGKNVTIERSVVGPYVSVGDDTTIRDSVVTNSIIGTGAILSGLYADNSMIGNFASLARNAGDFSAGDYTVEKG